MLFGVAQSASAVQCLISDPVTPGTPVWNGGGTCDYPITYEDPAGGSNLLECQYQAINWTESIDPAGWGPAVANPDSCTGAKAFMKSGGIVIGSTGDCTLNGQDTCWLYWKASDNSGNSDSGFLKSFDIDYIPPTVTINQKAGQADPTGVSPIEFTAVFSESVSGFAGSDVTISGTAGGTKTVTVTGSGTTYNVAVSEMTSSGTVIADIPAGGATDAVGNGNTVSTWTDKTITYDITKPEVHAFDVAPEVPLWVNGATVNIAVSFEVSDAGGSALKDVEVWRENPAGHIPTGWNKIGTILAGSLTLKLGSTTNYLGSYSDTASSLQDGKTYRYGIHVNDNAGNMRTEDDNTPADPYAGGPLSVQVDKTVPNNVTGLTSTSHTPSIWKNDNTVDTIWTAATDNAGGSGLDGYSFIWDTAATTLPDATKDIEQDIIARTSSSLANGNSHYLHIRSVDNAGNWKSDAMHLGPFFIDVAAPSAPTSVTYTPNPNNTGTHAVSWSGSSDTGGSNIKNYDVRRSSNGGGTWATVVTNNIAASWAQSPALGEGSYIYQVMTRDNASNTSPWSTNINTVVVDMTPPGIPGTPATGSPTSNTTPMWTWAASTGSPSSYDVQWATNPTFTQDFGYGSSVANSFTHSSALAQNTWYFKAKAKDAAGNASDFSGTGAVVIDTTPPGVPNLISPSGTISTTTPTFNWNTVSDPSGVTYTLWVDNDSNFGSLAINQSGLVSSSYTPSGGVLADMTTYYWKVRAVDGAGNTGNFPAYNTFTIILNQAPASPTSPLQFKNDGTTSIINQGFTNETNVKLRASAIDPDVLETVRLFFEVALNSGAFASPATPTTGTSCASGTLWSSCTNKIWYVSSASGNYSSTPFTGTTGVAGLSTATGYKWQVKACDDSNACSAWVAFNATRPNFSVDTAAPVVSFFAITPDSSVSPNWTRTNVLISWNDPGAGTGITDSGGSGLNRIEVWRAWDSTDNGLQPGEWNDSSPDPGTQANPIYTKNSGFTSSTSDDGSYPDSPPTGTYWYGLHAVDNVNNIGYEPSSKKALVDKDEPTTLIDSPVDSWLHRSAQQQSFLKTTDEDLESDINPSGCTFEVCSYESNGTEHCKGTENRACNIITNTEEIFVGPSATHCDYQGWGACIIFVQAADLAGNTAESSQEYNVDWEFPTVGKLYVTPTEPVEPYSIHVQEDVPTTYKVHATDNVGFSYCDLYIDGLLEQGSVVPSGCTTDCTVEFDGVVLPDPGGDHTYSNNYAVCYDASAQGGQGTVKEIVVETLTVSLSAIPSPGGSVNTLFDLAADTAGSTMTGDTTYGFDCRIDTGDCTADGNFGDCDFSITTSATAYTANNLCQYPVTAGTYTAKVAVQRGTGTAQDTVAIGPITTNSAPTAINPSVDAANPTDYCGVTGSPPVRVRWQFSDPDPGDTQGAYQVQASLRGTVQFDTGKISGSSQSYVFPPTSPLMWGVPYAWRVKVWDSPSDTSSSFVAGPSFTPPSHYYPVPNFTWSPAFPSAEELMQFTDQTNFAGTIGNSWFWDFDNSNGIQIDSTSRNPTHIYAQTKAYGVTLQATDNVGSCSASQSVNVSVPFPEWQEISPF